MTSLQREMGNCLNYYCEEKEQNNREDTRENGAESKQHFLFAVGVMGKLHKCAVCRASGDSSIQPGCNLTPWRGGFGRRPQRQGHLLLHDT